MFDAPLPSMRVLAACGLLLAAGCAPTVAPPPAARPIRGAPHAVDRRHQRSARRHSASATAAAAWRCSAATSQNLRAARARDGGAVLLVDAGDMFQGTLESNLTEGASVVAAYNALGYTRRGGRQSRVRLRSGRARRRCRSRRPTIRAAR